MLARVRVVLVVAVVCGLLMAGITPAVALDEEESANLASDTIHPDQAWLARLPFQRAAPGDVPEEQLRALTEYSVGATRLFPTLNQALGFYEFRTFTLRAVGETGEVWVAADLQFPLGDCRGLVEITQAQIDYMLGQFERKIRPTDVGYFGDPQKRDGSKATLPKVVGLPGDYYAGANREIILIDNVRDDNYYDFARSPTYIAGFFSPAFATALHRNIITVDAFDWQHRTGANPPHEPSDNPCRSRPSRPFLYEGTFAHEYQHLIHFDYDPGEELWVNEGMSMFAESLNGFSHPERAITEIGFEGAIQAFYGFVARVVRGVPIAVSGAENSLTNWGDQGSQEILADYGIADAFMLYVDEHYGGAKFMRAWQNSTGRGIAGFEAVLKNFGYNTTFAQVYHDFAVAMVVDKLIDEGAKGPNAARYSVGALHAMISLNTTEAYGTPGAPPWGSDYVKIPDPKGIESLAFTGGPDLVRKTPWTSVRTGPAGWKDGAVLWSGSRNNYDAWLVREVALGAGPQTLSFDTYFDIEECFDYGFVRVSTDGGKTFTSLKNQDTRDCVSKEVGNETDPRITAALPGFTGTTDGWGHTEFDLSAYAGQSILLAFYYAQDPGQSGNDTNTANNGWWIDNLMVNDEVLSDGAPTSLADFADITTFQPIPVAHTVQIIGIAPGAYTVMPLALGPGKLGTLSAAQLADLAAYDYIVAVVTFDAPTDARRVAPIAEYGRYALVVTRGGERALMPGGGLTLPPGEK